MSAAYKELLKLLRKAKKARVEIEQIFIDCEHYNSIHPGQEPIEADPGGVMAKQARALDEFILQARTRLMEMRRRGER